MLARVASTAAGSPRPLSITCMPASAKALAMPRPIPLVEPVMTAVFPASSLGDRVPGAASSSTCRASGARLVTGFISHGERDPGRRSDPGAGFPWDEFLERFAEKMLTPAQRKIKRLNAKIDAAQAEKAELTKQIEGWRKKRDELRS